MQLFYIDESGNTGKDLSHDGEPIHWLIAVGVTAPVLQAIETDLLAIATKHFGADARDPDFEFHGAEIFGGSGHARKLRPAERVRLYSEILQVIGTRGARVWVRGIHKHRHAARAAEKGYAAEHPYRLGFMYLVEELDRWLSTQQPSTDRIAAGDPALLGLLVSDEQDEVSRDLVSGFARWRQFGTDHGYLARDVRYLIDTIHYVKSQDSWLIQLADCVAYIRNRYQKVGTKHGWDALKYTESDKAVSALWTEHCAAHVVDSRIWPQ